MSGYNWYQCSDLKAITIHVASGCRCLSVKLVDTGCLHNFNHTVIDTVI
jgi:hypothetical protein